MLTGFAFPLGARGLCNINQLDRLTLDMLKTPYRSKLAKLMCFVKSPWLKTYQMGTNTTGGFMRLGLKEQGTNDSIIEDNKDADNLINYREKET